MIDLKAIRAAAEAATPGPWYRRFILAWGVFTGKYDALKWIEQ